MPDAGWELTVTIDTPRIATAHLAQVVLKHPARHIVVTETNADFPPGTMRADIIEWAKRVADRYDKAWEVYQDALGRVGTVIPVGEWRCRLESVKPEVQPPRITLRCLVFHPVLKIGGEADYVVDSLDDYSLSALQAWLRAWVEAFVARFLADKARDDQAVLDEAMGEAR